MSKGTYIKTVRAGQMLKIVKYSRALPRDNKASRQAKQTITQKAQKYINDKNTTERLAMLTAANFNNPRLAKFITPTFDDDNIPANQKDAQRKIADFWRILRKELKVKGRDTVYIYAVEGNNVSTDTLALSVAGQEWEIAPWKVKQQWAELDNTRATEGQGKPIRPHAHCMLNISDDDIPLLQSLWRYGQVFVEPMRVREKETFTRLASYITKESRSGIKKPGARSYIPSKGLVQPVVQGHWCSQGEQIEPPPDAAIINRVSEYNADFDSCFEYVTCWIPPQQDTVPKPHTRK